jgi:hypothetical protein
VGTTNIVSGQSRMADEGLSSLSCTPTASSSPLTAAQVGVGVHVDAGKGKITIIRENRKLKKDIGQFDIMPMLQLICVHKLLI